MENDVVNIFDRGENKDSQSTLSKHSGIGDKKWIAEGEKSDRLTFLATSVIKNGHLAKSIEQYLPIHKWHKFC